MNKFPIIILILAISCNNEKKETYSYTYNGEDLKCSCLFIDDKRHGQSLCYDSLGQLYLEENYRNDLRHGDFRIFFPDGTLNAKTSFEKGKVIGSAIEYYPNGSVKVYKYYIEGEEHAIYQKFKDTSGLATRKILPIQYTEIGSEFQDSQFIKLELLHSEYQRASIIAVIEKESGGDTIYSDSLSLVLGVSRKQKMDTIRGFLIEVYDGDQYGSDFPIEYIFN